MQDFGRRGLKRKAICTIVRAGSSDSMSQVILWFKNDLRLHDNYVVDRAQQLVKSGEAKEVIDHLQPGLLAYRIAFSDCASQAY